VGVEGGFLNTYPTECDKLSVKINKIFYKRLDLYSAFLYLCYMRERLIALIVFLMVTGHPCRMRVMAISVRHLPTTEMSFKSKK